MPSPKNITNSTRSSGLAIFRWLWWPLAAGVMAVYAFTLWVFLSGGVNQGSLEILMSSPELAAILPASIQAMGISSQLFLFLFLLPELITAIVFVVMGLLIRLRVQNDWFGLFSSFWMITFGLVSSTTFAATNNLPPALAVFVYLAIFFTYLGIVIFLIAYPDGKFHPRWISVVPILWGIFIFSTIVSDWWSWDGPQSAVLIAILLAFVLYSQIYRYRKVSTPAQREQAKWMIAAIVLNLITVTLTGMADVAAQSGVGADTAFYALVSNAVNYLGNLILVLAVGIAILRYRLWDIEVVVNRALIYAPLSLILAGIFAVSAVLINESTQQLFGTEDASTSAVVSALVVGTVFTPLRGRIEKWINRNLYADNSNLARDLVELSPDMRNLLSQKELAHLVAERVSKLLNSKAVGFYERAGSAYRLLAAAKGDQELRAPSISKKEQSSLEAGRVLGTSTSGLTIPLYVPRLRSKEVVGVMQVGLRKNGRGYSSDDKRALVELGGEVGTALYAVKLRTRKR